MKIATLLLWLSLALPALAQEAAPPSDLPDPGIFARLAAQQQMQVIDAPSVCDTDCQRVRGATATAVLAELDLVTGTRAAAFAWHHMTTVLIFWLVIVVVLAGLALAARQFFKGTNGDVSTFKIGVSGIEASSSGVGLLMFLISIAFFYLYLIYVYPINLLKPG